MPAGDFALRVPEMRQAVQMYESGRSMRQIADKFGVSQHAVKNALTYCGVARREKQEARRLRDRINHSAVCCAIKDHHV